MNSRKPWKTRPSYSLMGANRNDFLIEARCPRFGTGEGKGMVKSSCTRI